MNAKAQLAEKIGEWSHWDAPTCDMLAERIAQTQRIRAISEDIPAEYKPINANLIRLGQRHE